MPEAVGPKRIRTGLFVFKPEFNFLSKYLAGGERYNFAVVIFDFRIFQHGKLIASARSRCRNLIHIPIVFDEVF